MIINGDAYFKVTTRFKVRSIATIITRALTLKSHASTKIMFSKGEKEKVGGDNKSNYTAHNGVQT